MRSIRKVTPALFKQRKCLSYGFTMDFKTPESVKHPGQTKVNDFNGVEYTELGQKGPSNMALYPAKLGQSLPSTATNYSVRYETHGQPNKVLKLVNSEPFDDSKLRDDEVSLKILSAPINHADVFQIEGQYGVQLPLPAIGGQEGVAVVEKIGKDVKSVAIGDWVVPYRAGYGGTWRQHAIANESNIIKVIFYFIFPLKIIIFFYIFSGC